MHILGVILKTTRINEGSNDESTTLEGGLYRAYSESLPGTLRPSMPEYLLKKGIK